MACLSQSCYHICARVVCSLVCYFLLFSSLLSCQRAFVSLFVSLPPIYFLTPLTLTTFIVSLFFLLCIYVCVFYAPHYGFYSRRRRSRRKKKPWINENCFLIQIMSTFFSLSFCVYWVATMSGIEHKQIFTIFFSFYSIVVQFCVFVTLFFWHTCQWFCSLRNKIKKRHNTDPTETKKQRQRKKCIRID